MTAKRANGEGGVYFLKARQRYMYNFVDINGKRKSYVATPNTERGAEACLRKALAKRDAGETIDKTLTLAVWADQWLETRRIAGVRPRSLETYRMCMDKHVIPTLGSLRLDKLTPQHLDTLYSKLMRTKLAPSTVVRVHRTIGSMLNVAKRRRLVGHVVTQLVEAPRVPRYEARTLSVAETQQLLIAIKGHRHEAMWTFIIGTGCRYGEAAGLTWTNVDLDNATALICQQMTRVKDAEGIQRASIAAVKTDAGRRELALPQFVVDALRRQHDTIVTMREVAGRRWRTEHPDICFPSHLGALLTASPVLKTWHVLLKEAKLEGQPGQARLRLHDLRHTKGTLMADAGEDTTLIQRTLGHARQSITADLYVGRVPGALRASAERYDEMLSPSRHHAD